MGTARFKYETDAGNTFFARTDSDPELAAIRGQPPTEKALEQITFKSSKNSKQVGCKPREAILARTIGTENEANCITDIAKRYKYVVVLTAAHAGTLVPEVTTVTCDGQQYVFKGISAEDMN